MPIFQTAHFKVKPELREKCEQAIREFIDYIKANEPGTLRYTALQQTGNPNKFMHFFIFADEAAREKHRTSEGVQRFTSALYPELIGEVEFTDYTLLAST